jgi:hypothetical protein
MMTFSIMTFVITTFSLTTLRIAIKNVTCNMKAFGTITFSKMSLSLTTRRVTIKSAFSLMPFNTMRCVFMTSIVSLCKVYAPLINTNKK